VKSGIIGREFNGFLCRGGLPEYQWMNVPEALFLPFFIDLTCIWIFHNEKWGECRTQRSFHR
jgi:hypothetical protein